MEEERVADMNWNARRNRQAVIVSRLRAFRFDFEKAAFALSALILVAAILTVQVSQSPCRASRSEPVNAVLVTVQPGDTLWSLARDHSEDNVDLRRVVYEIAELNDLDNAVIHPGQGILVPSKEAQRVAETAK